MIERTPAKEGDKAPWSFANSHFTMSEVYFVVKPPEGTNKVPLASKTQLLYSQCYWVAFGRCSTPEDLVKTGNLKKVVATLEEIGESKQRQFILANMWGHRESGNKMRFTANLLTTPGARNRHKLYAKAAYDEWGHSDLDSLDRFFNEEKAATVLADSEMLAARWLIGYKIGRAGDAIEPLYDALECKLHPLWLALEPTYSTRLAQQISLPELTPDNKEILSVRMQVAKWQVAFQNKATKGGSIAWNKLRNETAKNIMPSLFSTFGQSMADYSACKRNWPSTLDFWGKLALAFRHVAVGAVYGGYKCPLTKWLHVGTSTNL